MKIESENTTYDGAEQITGLKRGTLFALVCRRKIPHLRVGPRLVLFPVQELREWLERHRVGTSQTSGRKAVRS
jgi:excisionase family DNA binding protein